MTETTPSSNRGTMIVLAYLWILALVPLLTEKEDQEVRWHAKHGVVLMLAEFAVWIVFSILLNIVGFVTLGLGCLVGLLWPVLMLLFIAIHIMCILKGLNGQRFLIPYVSPYADKF